MKFVSKYFLCCLICLLSSVTSAEMLSTVALTGNPVPGLPGGGNYGSIGGTTLASTNHYGPVLNSAGQVAFVGGYTGNGADVTAGSGIWSGIPGSLTLVAHSGDPAPGTSNGQVFSGIDIPILNSAGQVAFNGALKGSGVDATNNIGIWVGDTSSLDLVVREGDPAPGTSSGTDFSVFFRPLVLNSAGQIAFRARLRGNDVDRTNREGIWSGDSDLLTLVARQENQAPGLPLGVAFAEFFGDVALNSSGHMAFMAGLKGDDVNTEVLNWLGIWSDISGSLELVARQGNQAPGVPAGVTFSNFPSKVAINSAGQLTFNGSLDGGDVNSEYDNGVWSGKPGSLTLVARSGDPAPGTPSGQTFAFMRVPVLNSAGHTAFLGSLEGNGVESTNDKGIWSEGSGSLAMVAREGDHAPGTPSGVNFQAFDGQGYAFEMNSVGRIAFTGKVGGNGVDETNDLGIWAEDVTGSLQLIAREGDQLEVAPGDFRVIGTISAFGVTGNEDGHASSFNDLGQLAFRVFFTDGAEGIFISNLAAVPEPSCITLLLTALAMPIAFSNRRRKSR